MIHTSLHDKARLLLIAPVILLVGCVPVRHDPVLVAELPPILHKLDDTGAILSARVIELPSGRELFAYNPDQPFIPASNMKLVVTSSALDALGADHTFKTYLVRSGDDIWIVGTGDPAIGDPRIAKRDGRTTETVLDEWARLLADRGYTRIDGDLCYDESYLESQQIHRNWHEEDLIEWYACPVSGLNFNDNCIDVTITPAKPGEPVEYKIVPATDTVTVINQCVSHAEGEDAEMTRAPDRNTYTITGVASKQEPLQSKPVTQPGLLFADAFRVALARKGITLAGAIRPLRVERNRDGSPRDGEILTVHESTMADVLWRTNTHSQNLFAECLAKLVGRRWAQHRRRSESGSWANASKAVPAHLRKLGVNTSKLVVDDGSGLSDRNRVTARLLTDLLRTMFVHPDTGLYRASLSKVGVEGTLRKRMSDLKGRVFAKTGYIGGVRTLSGYVQTRSGQWLAFSFLYNRIPGSVKPYERLQDDACRVLVDWAPEVPKVCGAVAACQR